MRVFVATPLTQGDRPDDHYCCLDGEIVLWDTTADAQHGPEDPCECRTGFFGAYSSGRTTTAMVTDDPEITETRLRDIVREALIRDTGTARDTWAITRKLAALAACFAPGEVVDRDRDRDQLTRRWVPAGMVEWDGHSHPVSREGN